MGLQTFYGEGPHTLLRAGSRAARIQITVSGIPNCLKSLCNSYSTYVI